MSIDDNEWVHDLKEIAAGTGPLNSASMHPPDGDINLDGIVDTADILIGIRGVLFDGPLNPAELARKDVAPLVKPVRYEMESTHRGGCWSFSASY